MYSDILSSDTSEGLENINDLPFLLDPETGDISLNFDPQKGVVIYIFTNAANLTHNMYCKRLPYSHLQSK